MPLTLADLPLDELLPHLARRPATGTLSVSTPRHRKKLYLVDGRLAGIASDNPRELLGHFLVGWGLISEVQLSEAMRIHEQLGTPVGRILERMGAVAADALTKALRAQAEEALFDLFLQPASSIRFLENALPADRPLTLRLDLDELVVEGIRRRHRQVEIRRTLGGPDVVPEATPTPDMPELSARDRHIMSTIDGARDADAIALVCHLVPFQVVELIERGVRAGFITVTRHAAAGAAPDGLALVQRADDALAVGDLRHAWEALEALRATDSDQTALLEVGRIERVIEEHLAQHRISGYAIPRLTDPLGLSRAEDIRPSEAFVLSRINDQWSLREIARIAPLSALEFGVIVDALLCLRLIELRDPRGGAVTPLSG